MQGGRTVCELFGISSAKKFYANYYLKTFFSHSVHHPHGWGLACISSKGAQIEKESVQASKSNYLKERLSQPICSELLLAHIRYATIGNIAYRNCHPFCGKDCCGNYWTLIHNGTIFDFSPINGYLKKQCGDTDSERVFLYFLDKINEAQRKKAARLNFEEKFELFDEIICCMSKNNKLNLLFTDGKYLFAHTNCLNTLYFLEENGTVILSTTALNEKNWRPLPFTRLTAFQKGKLIKTGTIHHNEYIENAEAMKLLYSIFANL